MCIDDQVVTSPVCFENRRQQFQTDQGEIRWWATLNVMIAELGVINYIIDAGGYVVVVFGGWGWGSVVVVVVVLLVCSCAFLALGSSLS